MNSRTSAPVESTEAVPDYHRLVVQDLTETVCRFRPDGIFTYVNEVYCRLFGKSEKELVGQRWHPMAVAEDVPMIEEKLRSISTEQPVVVIENRVYAGEGRVRWMQFVNRGLFDKAGHLVEMQAVGRDITERVEAEQKLKESQQRWRFALESSGFGVWDWDVEHDQIFFSSQWKALLGYEPQDEMPTNYADFQSLLHPGDKTALMAAVQEHLSGRTPSFVGEFRLRSKNGTWKWALSRGRVIEFDPAGQPKRMIGTTADISKRKAAEEREAHSLQLIAEGAPSIAVLEAITRNVEAAYPGMRCSVMLVDASGTRLQMKTAPGLPDFAREQIDGMPIGPNIGCCGAAAHAGVRVICSDVLADERMEPFHKLALQAKLRACWSEPIINSAGKVLGTLACYHEAPHEPSQSEMQSVSNAARLAALAIEREWKEQALKISEERYARALRGTTDGLWDWNIATGDVYFSPRWKQMLGFAENEMPLSRETAFLSRLHPDDVSKVQAARKAHFEQRASYHVEFRLQTKSGAYRWFLARGQAEWNECGEAVRMAGTISDISERKLAEQALEQSEKSYRRIVETAEEGIWVIDTETRTTFANPKMARMLGYSVDEMMGKPLDAFMDDEARASAAEHVRRRQLGIAEQHEFRFLRKDGASVWTLMATSPIYDDDGAYAGALAMVTDISERKKTEQALEESEQRFRAVFEQAAVGIAVIDTPTGRYVDVNQRMCEINQRTREEMLRLTFMDVTHPADLQADLEQMEQLKAGSISSFHMEKRNVAPDGTLTWINLTVAPMWRPGEPPLRHIAVVKDISERKLAEFNYRRELAYNQALVNYTSAFIVVMDVEGRFVHGNAAFFSAMGYSEQEVIGKTPWEIGLMDAQETVRSKERFARLLRGEDNPPADVRLRTRGGAWHAVELRSTSTRTPDGKLDRIVITGTDMTERNYLQREILRVVEQELARVGHDLHDGVGQTMTGMVIMMETLVAELQGEAREHATRIHQLMNESVAEVRRMSHGLSPTSVKYRGLAGALNLLAETVRTNFRTPCVCDVDTSIVIDNEEKEAHLFRIAQEAVNNALRHGKPDKVQITLQAMGAGECELRIEDDGIGMKKSKKASEHGPGIGMRVMEYRANLIGGRLKIHPKPKRGLVVTCQFDIDVPGTSKPAPKIRDVRWKPRE